MAEMTSVRNLEVWKKSVDLVVDCYRATSKFPRSETYGLSSQLQRAAVSVPANIAEGRARTHSKEFLQHLNIAYGSLAELETHIEVSHRLGYVTEPGANRLFAQTAEIGRMLNGLRRSVSRRA